MFLVKKALINTSFWLPNQFTTCIITLFPLGMTGGGYRLLSNEMAAVGAYDFALRTKLRILALVCMHPYSGVASEIWLVLL
jgi:hypothetical protein